MSFIINTTLYIFVLLINRMKNILILTDFSEKSWNSILYALGLFQKERCNFFVLNAGIRDENEIQETGYNQLELVHVRNKRDVKREFDKLIKRIDSLTLKNGHHFYPVIEDDNIIEATRKQVKDKDIDLIVIGADDMSLKGKLNKNSISEDVITKVKCSVLVVPKKAKFNGLEEIGFPTDYTNFYEAKLFEELISKVSCCDSALKFLHLCKKKEVLNKEQKWNKETLHDYFIDEEHSFHSETNKNLEESLEYFIDSMGINLIVLAAKNLNLLEQILFRPKIEDLNYYSSTPFLALHQSNK
ncbi:Nucleotide-binding universal stress protein, UspA family [Lutibacter flavus]|uniref:Nucleotide-binding universal stress protein, UspA family n=2 Tax=Lutibacter flavus TaxID=691689 RepID=A0A238Y6C0_9FLAO|nr:Nucleotide-binding universal stress protein, UspA family [Lutibacter flavus]